MDCASRKGSSLDLPGKRIGNQRVQLFDPVTIAYCAVERGIEAIHILVHRQFESVIAHIGGVDDHVARQFALNIQIPLLHIRQRRVIEDRAESCAGSRQGAIGGPAKPVQSERKRVGEARHGSDSIERGHITC